MAGKGGQVWLPVPVGHGSLPEQLVVVRVCLAQGDPRPAVLVVADARLDRVVAVAGDVSLDASSGTSGCAIRAGAVRTPNASSCPDAGVSGSSRQEIPDTRHSRTSLFPTGCRRCTPCLVRDADDARLQDNGGNTEKSGGLSGGPFVMSGIDFSSWQALLSTALGLSVITLVIVGVRLLAMQTVQQRRERHNRQINGRLRTLIAAYKTLGGSFTGDLAVDPTHLRDLRAASRYEVAGDGEAVAGARVEMVRDWEVWGWPAA